MKIADVGDVDICLYDITKAADRITEYYKVRLCETGKFSLTL